MKFVIDRFEGEYAVVETDNGFVNVPKILFPDACEGDTIDIQVIKEETKKEELKNRLDNLFKRS